MELGVSFPIFEIGTDPGPIKAFLQAVDDLGFDYLTNIDHILGVDEKSHPDYDPIPGFPAHYLLSNPFHEMFTLFGFAAAVTSRIKLFSTILLLAQRQTALVAKQAAEVDILSNGRVMLGVGVGHTDIEFRGLNVDFASRGRRIEEQIDVLRMLWTQDVVHFNGEFHDLDGVGINPLPVQRPIPIWMGGWSESVMRRAVRMADGICFPMRPIAQLQQMVADTGRDPQTFGFVSGVPLIRGRNMEEAVEAVEEQRSGGLTHVTVSTEGQGYAAINEQIEALTSFVQTYRGGQSARTPR
jgi:probable F420-dependent oxidoreductase